MPMPRYRGPVAVAVPALITALTLTSCSSNDPATTEGGVPLTQSGKLVTCTHLPYEPFQFNRDGEIVGFDVDLVDLVAEELGVQQEVIDTPFETIQSGEDLNAGKCDLAAAGMTITDVRKENLDFSDPYFEATQALLTTKGSGLASFDDLAGKSLGVQAATTGEEYARNEAGPDVEIVQFEDLGLLLIAVQTGQVDAGINDNGVVYDFANKNDDVEVTTEFNTGEQYGIGVKKGNTELLDVINEVLAAAQSDGRYDEIYKTWFGTAPKA